MTLQESALAPNWGYLKVYRFPSDQQAKRHLCYKQTPQSTSMQRPHNNTAGCSCSLTNCQRHLLPPLLSRPYNMPGALTGMYCSA